jgi:hypothetical protein
MTLTSPVFVLIQLITNTDDKAYFTMDPKTILHCVTEDEMTPVDSDTV